MHKNETVTLTLFDYFRSSAAYRVRITLNLKGLPYRSHAVNLVKGEQRSVEHLQRQQQGLVPALQHGDACLQQSLAICEYLDEQYPDTARLLPGNTLQRAKIRAAALLIACDIHPVNNLRILNYLRDELAVDEAARMQWYRHWVEQGFQALESMLAPHAGRYCFGDEPTLADVCLLPQVFNATRFKVDMTQFPLLQRIAENLEQLEAFATAHPSRQPDAQP